MPTIPQSSVSVNSQEWCENLYSVVLGVVFSVSYQAKEKTCRLIFSIHVSTCGSFKCVSSQWTAI